MFEKIKMKLMEMGNKKLPADFRPIASMDLNLFHLLPN